LKASKRHHFYRNHNHTIRAPHRDALFSLQHGYEPLVSIKDEGIAIPVHAWTGPTDCQNF
jgi:hypothetical protein